MSKRIIASLLVLVLLFTAVPVGALAAQPETQTSVDTGDVSIEGTNGFGNLLSQEITQSQLEAADESAAYEAGYTVTDLTIEGTTATVTYDSMEEALLVVALYTEDGMRMVTSATATVTADATEAAVEFTGEMPEYFLVSAYLVDTYDLSPLCAAYDTPMYTREMQELLASTVEDYDADRVLNLDDDNTTNFAVYAETTKIIEAIEGVNTVASVNNENATYVIKNADEQIMSLVEGDVFVYPYAENEILIVKVASIEVIGTTVFVTGDALDLEEVFSYMKIESASDTADMTVDDSTAAEGITYVGLVEDGVSPQAWEGGGSATAAHSFEIDFDEEYEEDGIAASVTVTGELKFELAVSLNYYISLSEQFIEFKADPSVTMSLSIEGTISGSYPIGDFSVSPVAGVFVGFAPEIKAEYTGTVTLSMTFSMTIGVAYGNDTGLQNLTTKPKIKLNLDIEGTIFLGIDFVPNARILHEKVASLELSAVVGFEIAAKMSGRAVEILETGAENRHSCWTCLGIDVVAKAELTGELKFLDLDWLTVNVDLLKLSFELGSMYLSSEESGLKYGTCSNYTYRITVQVLDENGAAIADASVTAGADNTVTNKRGNAVFYLAEGSHDIGVSAGGLSKITRIYVDDARKVTVRLSEEPEGDTGIGGILGSIASEVLEDNVFRFNGHVYQIFDRTMTWSDARDYCEALGGHLATVTSAAEQAYIEAINTRNANLWLGGYRDDAFNWYWVTGEAWEYTNWNEGEPNNSGLVTPETCLVTWPDVWNDLGDINTSEQSGFICEWEDESDKRSYEIFSVNLSWADAQVYCEKLGGHLATITSAQEQRLIDMLNTAGATLWIGAYRDDAFNWHWVTGEPWTFDNWASGEPNNYNNNENRASVSSGLWNDLNADELKGFICEWEKGSAENASALVYTINSKPEGVAPNAVYPGDYGTEKADSFTLKTASFKGLVPNEQYVLLAMKSIEVDDPLASDNLLFIDQGIALEDGTLSFRYVQRENADISYVVACGASNKNLKDAEITFPEMTADGELQVVEPTVVYDGVTLTEGRDYVIVGTVDYTEGGTYTCYIRGIHNYTGLVECSYTVAAAKVATGWSGATQWTLTDDGMLTVYGSGKMKNYGYGGGQPWLNKGVDITSVVIEEGVTSVGSGAFRNLTTLETVSLPDTMTQMGEAAFYGTGLKTVEIPASLWTIQPYTFKNCTALASVRFNEGNLQKISDGAFYGTALTELVLPDCLDILDVYAFKGCANLTSITIGSSLTELREAVFYGTAIPTIEIPEGITKIGPYAFKNCVALETIDLPESLKSVGEASFYACTGLKSVELPDAVTSIGNYAFRKCSGLTSVEFGSGLVTIGECSFYGCTGLTEIVIPDKVTTIKPYAFKTCTGLTSVILGSSVAAIGEGAFNTCTGLRMIVFPASLTTIGDYCFSGSYNLWKLTFQGDAPSIGTGAFKGMNAYAYYPGGNATWTSDIMQNYGGTIAWKAT